MDFLEYQNIYNDINKKVFDFKRNPSTFIWDTDTQNNTSNSILFDKSKWKLFGDDKDDEGRIVYNFFGNTPASAMQGLGSMIGAVGGVWDAYNKNKWQKKAYALEKAAIDRQLERERIGENTLHSVWGKKDGSL